MKKIFLSKQKIFFISFLIIVLCIILYSALDYLSAFNYNIEGIIHTSHRPIKNFKKYKPQFEIIVNGVQDFINDNPDYFDNYQNFLSVDEQNHRLVFIKKSSADFEETYYKISDTVSDFSKAFPDSFRYEGVMIDQNYPNYIFFTSDEKSASELIFTGGDYPTDLIKKYREDNDFVYIKKIAYGWYDVDTN